ncbi:MAG: hypothetical protein II972_04810, partial [Elusimicrobiaceae bacterium]|nr:hypothetical protein [Elusimicrobiaceae bacterium]
MGSSFGAVGAGRNAKQGLKDTGKVEIKSPYSITLEDAYFSGVKSLTDLGMPPEDAEKLTFSLLKKAAAPETIKEIQDMIKEENSNLTYLNNDEDQNAAAVKAAIEKATAPDRIVREQAFNIADKVEEEALKAGRAPEEAAASAALEQARAIGMYNLTDVLPRDLYQINIEAESSAENDLSGQEDASFDFGGNMETDTAEIDAFTNMDDLLASLSKEQRTEVLGKVNFDKRLDPLYKEIGEFKAAVNKKIKDGKTLTQYVATEATAEEKATAERLFNEFEQKQLEIAKEFLKEQKTPQTLYQEGIEEKENKPELFKADKQVSENFAREVNESLNNGNPKEKRFFEMGKVPAVYNFVGLPMQDLKTNKLAMRKALGLLTEEELKKDKRLHNHNVPLDVVNRLVDLVAEPIAIFKSNNKEDKNKFVAVLDAKFEDKQIVAILSPNEKQKGFTFIPTAYEKDDFETFVRETSKNKNILYINEEGAKSSGLTLQTNFIEQIAPNNNILTKDEIVKGEFLLVDGKKRAARNSEGNLIHTNLAAIRNFYKWFGDSKVVDEQGRPLVVYHGTSGKFNIFKGVKHFFTDNKDLADAYGSAETMPVYLRAENPLMVDAYKQSFEDIANAKDFKKKQKDLTETDYKKLAKYHNMPVEEIKEFFPKEGDSLVNLARAYGEKSRSTNGWADYAKEKGYDGVIIKDVVDNTGWENADIAATDYIVFEPTQIKSVYNKGTFDEKNPNIYYQDKRGSVSFADDIKQAFIKFNETSDKSTLIHELAHIWLKDIERFAQVSTKPEFLEFKQNLDAWLGEPVDGVYTREQQEKFAKTFEKYMQEGKAPNAELQSIFEKFKEWLQEIYSAVRDYVKLTPEAIKTFDTLLASEKGTYNIDKIRNKTAQAKAVVEKIKKGQAATIDGVNVKDIKEALKVMNARIPAAPKENLLRTLRSKGADYANAAKIDKEAYKNARVPNKKTGIQDNLALTLRDWGYMDFDDSAVDTYDGLVEQNEIAADLIDRAFSGEKVY